MKIHIYTDIDTLFGRAARLWMDVLLEAGHDVEFMDLGSGTDAPLPDVGPCDLNLLIVGIFAFERFGTQGLPRHGKHLLWMLDPLTRDSAATMHHHKARLFDVLAPRLHAVIAMDAAIERYLNQHFPALTTFRLPYLVAEKHITEPRAEAAREREVLMLGGDSPRRREAEQYFLASSVPGLKAEFISGGMWGAARDAYRAGSRICLNIHADTRHTYFDQFRTFETWAAGTPVLSDICDGLAEFGIEAGVHLAMAEPKDMPAMCAELLADAPRREAMAQAAQALLRERFTPAAWRGKMLAMVDSLA